MPWERLYQKFTTFQEKSKIKDASVWEEISAVLTPAIK